MIFNIDKVKIVVTIPKESTSIVRNEICKIGAGIIGNYSFCSTSIDSIGTFIPNKDANPYIGRKNELEFVSEDRLEVICPISKVKSVISKLREVHPYEEPSIDIIPLLNESDFK